METINITPNWDNMRRFVLNVYRTDPMLARKLASEMGDEAPTFPSTETTS